MGVRPMSSMTTRPMSSMTTAPAPDPPELAVTAEQIWLDVEAEVLATEVEEFLATARTPRPTPPRTRTLAAGLPAPDPDSVADTVRRPPRRAPALHVRATERAPPHHEHAVAAIGRGRSERR